MEKGCGSGSSVRLVLQALTRHHPISPLQMCVGGRHVLSGLGILMFVSPLEMILDSQPRYWCRDLD